MFRSGVEKRRHERVKVALNVNWGLTRECVNDDRITSLSLGGYFLQTSSKLAADQEIFLRFFFKEEHILRGSVRYSMQGVGAGVEFAEVKEEDKKALQELIEFYKKSS
ncbi:MAG: hypothetical protein AUG51_11550 [Acidobacteria bacterium 13_1_20CM_3_53_8]|nr:MAG: hypothetical protein AUG51_11550 [Acidobacteria bacterium 13_1_20CM_3_53_8]